MDKLTQEVFLNCKEQKILEPLLILRAYEIVVMDNLRKKGLSSSGDKI